jgi:hypothetical protein
MDPGMSASTQFSAGIASDLHDESALRIEDSCSLLQGAAITHGSLLDMFRVNGAVHEIKGF